MLALKPDTLSGAKSAMRIKQAMQPTTTTKPATMARPAGTLSVAEAVSELDWLNQAVDGSMDAVPFDFHEGDWEARIRSLVAVVETKPAGSLADVERRIANALTAGDPELTGAVLGVTLEDCRRRAAA